MSDYVRSLIREDAKRRDEKKLEQMLLEGLRAKRGMQVGSKEWDAFEQRLMQEAKERAKTKRA